MLITIITPSYNAEKSIEKAILSVIRQKNSNLQYIIVDGGSTDKTLEIISRYKDKIDIIISEKDNGIGDAYNKGIELATGDLIGIVAADDQLINCAIDKLKKNYDGYSDVVCGNVIEYNGERYIRRTSDRNLDQLRKKTSLKHQASFVKRNAYFKFGKYSTEYKCAMDRELFVSYFTKGATFQIIDMDISFSTSGGISTADPTKYAYIEDTKISINHGVSPIKAKSYHFKAVVQYYTFLLIKRLLKIIKLNRLFNNMMISKGYYIHPNEIEQLNLL